MTKFLTLIVLIALAATAGWYSMDSSPRFAELVGSVADRIGVTLPIGARASVETSSVWKTAPVERGPIQSTVLATGTLQPVKTVSISSQISGQIVEVLADFNSKVATGDVIARIDATTLQAKIAAARADLAVSEATVHTKGAAVDRARAELVRIEAAAKDADRAFENAQRLAKSGAGTERALEQAEMLEHQTNAQMLSGRADIAMAEADLEVARATVEQRRAAVSIAQIDLDRTEIHAPLNGIVIDRQIDVGQTVATSLQAPTMFVIAADLAEMQLEASIDEADIGRVKVDQAVRFTVDAYPGRSFQGKVSQVRRAGKTVQNVVTYTAVVTADNSSLDLFPGMTANVRLVVDRRDDALKVPSAALRFRPATDVAADPNQRRARTVRPSGNEGTVGKIHIVDATGKLTPIDVKVGIASEAQVEVTSDKLKPGDLVVIGRNDDAAAAKPRSPIGF